jgi:hypothetical protein
MVSCLLVCDRRDIGFPALFVSMSMFSSHHWQSGNGFHVNVTVKSITFLPNFICVEFMTNHHENKLVEHQSDKE